MKFIELNAGFINADYIVKIVLNEEPYKNGDYNIEITLHNGEILLEPEVSYDGILEKHQKILNELEKISKNTMTVPDGIAVAYGGKSSGSIQYKK